MNNKPRYADGKRREITRQILNNGCIPYRDFRFITDNTDTFRRQIDIMIREGILYKEFKNGFHYVTFKTPPQSHPRMGKYVEENFNSTLLKYFEIFGYPDARQLMSEQNGQRKRRIIRNAETSIFIESCGIECEIGTKPHLLSGNIPADAKVFYNSRETKGVNSYEIINDKDKQQLIGRTYTNGMLVTPGGTYLLIDTYDMLLEYDFGETKISNYTENIVATRGLPKYRGVIILFKDYDTQYRYLTTIKKTKHFKSNWIENFNRLLYAYPKVYCVTIDDFGADMIRLMSTFEWEERILSQVLPDKPRNVNSTVDCDGEDKDSYYLCQLIPDMKRLRQFLLSAYAVNDKDKFKVICFEEQKDFILKITDGYCRVYTVNYNDIAPRDLVK